MCAGRSPDGTYGRPDNGRYRSRLSVRTGALTVFPSVAVVCGVALRVPWLSRRSPGESLLQWPQEVDAIAVWIEHRDRARSPCLVGGSVLDRDAPSQQLPMVGVDVCHPETDVVDTRRIVNEVVLATAGWLGGVCLKDVEHCVPGRECAAGFPVVLLLKTELAVPVRRSLEISHRHTDVVEALNHVWLQPPVEDV